MVITLSINENMLAKVDEFAKTNGFTRSGLFITAVNDYMRVKEIEPALKEQLLKLEEIANAVNDLSVKAKSIEGNAFT